MTPERHAELDSTFGQITSDEMSEGWHYCPEWDGLLVNMNDTEGEGSVCTCSGWTEKEIKENN